MTSTPSGSSCTRSYQDRGRSTSETMISPQKVSFVRWIIIAYTYAYERGTSTADSRGFPVHLDPGAVLGVLGFLTLVTIVAEVGAKGYRHLWRVYVSLPILRTLLPSLGELEWLKG